MYASCEGLGWSQETAGGSMILWLVAMGLVLQKLMCIYDDMNDVWLGVATIMTQCGHGCGGIMSL